MSKALPLIEELFQKIIGPFAATDVAPLLFEPDNVEDRVSHLINHFNRHPQFIPPLDFDQITEPPGSGGSTRRAHPVLYH